MRALFDHNPDAIFLLDRDGRVLDANQAILQFGAHNTRENVVGHHFRDWLDAEDLPRHQSYFDRALAGETVAYRSRAHTFTGRRLQIYITSVPMLREGVVEGVFCIVRDETEKKEIQRRIASQDTALLESEARLRSLFDHNPDPVLALDLEGTMLACNDASERVSGLRRDQIVGRNFAEFLGHTNAELAREAFVSAVSGTPATLTFATVNGAGRAIEVNGTVIPQFSSGKVVGIYAVFQDITERREAERRAELQRERLRTLAYYDPLTGLPNRTMLAERVRDAIEVAQSRLSRFALLFIDLDRFKDVNDTLGHARGDVLLRSVALRLTEAFGKTSIARVGSDEFVLLLTDVIENADARQAAERALAVLGEPFALDDYEQFISASIGIAMYPEDGRDEQALVKNADIAMSRAKDRGRNGYYFYDPTLEAPIHLRLSQEKLLRQALEREEFTVHYQPQFDLRTGRIVSVEALVRWNHPKSGLILPNHFIPSAEISGLIVALGEWVLATALDTVAGWQREFGQLRLAVNLSARQFHERTLRQGILNALQAARIHPSLLEVEITESIAMDDAAQTASILRELAASGIRIAVDDFGTGYSSLSYLRQFELDVLKVDASFVHGIGRTSGDETIVNTIIGMAHNLDLEVIAEGVETREQLDFLTAQGCDVVQGYVISPALAAPDLARFLHERMPSAPTG